MSSRRAMSAVKAISKKKSGSEMLKCMEHFLSAKRRLLAQLQHEHNQLQHQQDLLLSFCDTFDWMRQQQLLTLLPDAVLESAIGSINSLATEEELGLLQQLHPLANTTSSNGATAGNNEAGCGSGSGNAAHSDTTISEASGNQVGAAIDPISPPEDPLWLLKHLLSATPCIDLETITLEQLRWHHVHTVRELSLYLLQFEAKIGNQVAPAYSTGQTDEGQGPMPASAAFQKLQELVCGHLKLIAELCIAKPELITQMQLVNAETGEQATEPDKQRHHFVLQQLGLTRQQQERIARSLVLYKRLLSPVLQELKELQLQQAGVSSKGSDADGARDSSGAGDGSPGLQQPPAMPAKAAADSTAAEGTASEMPHNYIKGAQLEVQQKRSGRMKLLMQKDFLMRTCFASCAYGCLSYVQMARLYVLMFPVYPTPFLIFTEVAEQVAQQEAWSRMQQEPE